jgi:hypothetical protein
MGMTRENRHSREWAAVARIIVARGGDDDHAVVDGGLRRGVEGVGRGFAPGLLVGAPGNAAHITFVRRRRADGRNQALRILRRRVNSDRCRLAGRDRVGSARDLDIESDLKVRLARRIGRAILRNAINGMVGNVRLCSIQPLVFKELVDVRWVPAASKVDNRDRSAALQTFRPGVRLTDIGDCPPSAATGLTRVIFGIGELGSSRSRAAPDGKPAHPCPARRSHSLWDFCPYDFLPIHEKYVYFARQDGLFENQMISDARLNA